MLKATKIHFVHALNHQKIEKMEEEPLKTERICFGLPLKGSFHCSGSKNLRHLLHSQEVREIDEHGCSAHFPHFSPSRTCTFGLCLPNSMKSFWKHPQICTELCFCDGSASREANSTDYHMMPIITATHER